MVRPTVGENPSSQRNLPLTEEEWDALISIIEEHGHNAGTKGPFEAGALPGTLFDKIMERCSYEYEDYDYIRFDQLPSTKDERIRESWEVD
jgi:hypothetical protein